MSATNSFSGMSGWYVFPSTILLNVQFDIPCKATVRHYLRDACDMAFTDTFSTCLSEMPCNTLMWRATPPKNRRVHDCKYMRETATALTTDITRDATIFSIIMEAVLTILLYISYVTRSNRGASEYLQHINKLRACILAWSDVA